MKHGIEPPVAQTMQELGTKVAQLRYDALIIFFRAFKEEIIRQRDADEAKNRFKISDTASYLILALFSCLHELREMLDLSIPHMEEELKAHPLLFTDYDEL